MTVALLALATFVDITQIEQILFVLASEPLVIPQLQCHDTKHNDTQRNDTEHEVHI